MRYYATKIFEFKFKGFTKRIIIKLEFQYEFSKQIWKCLKFITRCARQKHESDVRVLHAPQCWYPLCIIRVSVVHNTAVSGAHFVVMNACRTLGTCINWRMRIARLTVNEFKSLFQRFNSTDYFQSEPLACQPSFFNRSKICVRGMSIWK